ncbi:MAG: hypothetical protein ACT4NY_20805 [Pseudonocardiales bacterium]
MSRKAENSPKAERDKVRDRMRGLGCTVGQIAAEMSRRFLLRPRSAWRYALGWPQWKLAQEYNTRHPGAKLSESRISEFEAWPHGGSPPTLRYLVGLAATYGHGCTAAQLVDADDLERLNPADRCLLTTGHPPDASDAWAALDSLILSLERRGPQVSAHVAGQPGSGLVVPADLAVWQAVLGLQLPGELAALVMMRLESLAGPDGDALATPGGWDRVYDRLVPFLSSWANTVKRRLALRALGWAATAASVGYSLNPDEQARVAAVFSNPGRVDEQTIGHIDAVLWQCKRQDDALGPRAVLDAVLAQRHFARTLVPDCPAELRPRLLSVLSSASRQAGWLCFDLNDFDSAGYYYEDARARAHEAQDIELGAFVLCHMSHLATWQGQPRIGIDHGVAAGQWANHTSDLRVRAYTADVTARAYAADGQRTACLTALDAAHTTLTRVDDQQPGYLDFYDEALLIGVRCLCHLEVHDGQPAVEYGQQSLSNLDPSFARNLAMTTAYLGRAYVQCNEIDEAAGLLGDAGEVAARNSSVRLIGLLKQGRADLQPWKDSTAVRALDDRLRSCGVILG